MGSFPGAGASKSVTEVHKGFLRLVGNKFKSVKAEGSLNGRLTSRPWTKVCLSDPAVLCGKAAAQRIKVTPGITG